MSLDKNAGALPPPETVTVSTKRVCCDGGGTATGHPRVWMDMGEDMFVDCKYCDRRFILDPNAPEAH
ncbi:zinc-finger domain-containing protein [Robiginitomaculum antarcticum]|uniref:zinc-finger domain-containing protein n=1 Tax=Robiginitomaculum antarcticum TaxID=437507 RepID=UPI000376EBC8|nr:zinc-finger domain-containing protein [Robiginitomaculum antarcticum]